GRRVRILWQGAEYRGRGRETLWQGKLTVPGNRIARFAPVHFLHPGRPIQGAAPGAGLSWASVTTGHLAGTRLLLAQADGVRLTIETNIVAGEIDLSNLTGDTIIFECGGLGRRLSVYRLPEDDWSRRMSFAHTAVFKGGADLPVYVRATQADGHQAWSSPIYLVE